MSDERIDKIIGKMKRTSEWGLVDNPEQIIRQSYKKLAKWSDSTLIGFLKAELLKESRAKSSNLIEGIVFGCADKKDTKLPVSWPVLMKNGKLTKAIAWSPNVVPQGINKIKFTGILNHNFGNYGDIEVVDISPIADISRFKNAALTIEDEDTWEHKKGMGDPVLVSGKIQWVNAIFGKDGDGNRTDPIPLVDEKGRPVFELVLAYDGLVELHLRLIEQNRAYPYVEVTDLVELLKEVETIHPEDPESQAKFLQTVLQGREVMAIGEVMYIGERYTQDEVRTLPVYIRLAGLVEIGEDDDTLTSSDTLKSSKPVEKLVGGESDEEYQERIQEQIEEDIEIEVDEEEVEEEVEEPKPKKKKDKSPIEEEMNIVEKQIKEYCELIEKSPLKMTIEELRDTGIGENVSDMLLNVILKNVRNEVVKSETKARKED